MDERERGGESRERERVRTEENNLFVELMLLLLLLCDVCFVIVGVVPYEYMSPNLLKKFVGRIQTSIGGLGATLAIIYTLKEKKISSVERDNTKPCGLRERKEICGE